MNSFIEKYGQEFNQPVIAFDVFDTIITRNVHPEYVKKLWAKQLKIYLGLQQNSDEIYNIRAELERQICENNKEKGLDLEFSYYELANCIYKKLNIQINKDTFIDVCIQIEIDTEFRIQKIDMDWLEFVKKRCGDAKIICISDFYLTSDILKKIFLKHDIMKYFDEIYVSSDYMLTKRSGRLYKKVLENSKINPENIIMVGDNIESDINKAIENKLNAYHIDRKLQYDEYKKHNDKYNSKKNSISKVKKHIEENKYEYFEQISYSLYSYIEKLYEQLLKDKQKNVFFLSREGEFLKKIFDLYREEQRYIGNQYINSHYLIVSRKSTFLPSLSNISNENFQMLFRQYVNISSYDFLSSLNFEKNEIESIKESLKIENIKVKESNFPNSDIYINIINNDIFKKIYNSKRLEQHNNFKQYVESFGVDIEKEGMNVVDVGWKGTIQDNIYNIYRGKVIIRGYYLGLVANWYDKKKNIKKGILFSCIDNKSEFFDVFNENRSLFEIILAATHGSAKKYTKNRCYIQVETSFEKEEQILYENNIKFIQESIMKEFKYILENFKLTNIDYDDYKKIFVRMHARMVFLPKSKEIEFFRSMYHFENFGVFQYTTFNKNNLTRMQKVNNLFKFIRNPKKMLSNSIWIPITLEDLGLSYLKMIYGKYRLHIFDK